MDIRLAVVNEAEKERIESEVHHQNTAMEFNATEQRVKQLQKELKRQIAKSRPYFEQKAKFNAYMEEQKKKVSSLEKGIVKAKQSYGIALKNLESISDEIHQHRYENKVRREMGTRGSGVGAESPPPLYDQVKEEDKHIANKDRKPKGSIDSETQTDISTESQGSKVKDSPVTNQTRTVRGKSTSPPPKPKRETIKVNANIDFHDGPINVHDEYQALPERRKETISHPRFLPKHRSTGIVAPEIVMSPLALGGPAAVLRSKDATGSPGSRGRSSSQPIMPTKQTTKPQPNEHTFIKPAASNGARPKQGNMKRSDSRTQTSQNPSNSQSMDLLSPSSNSQDGDSSDAESITSCPMLDDEQIESLMNDFKDLPPVSPFEETNIEKKRRSLTIPKRLSYLQPYMSFNHELAEDPSQDSQLNVTKDFSSEQCEDLLECASNTSFTSQQSDLSMLSGIRSASQTPIKGNSLDFRNKRSISECDSHDSEGNNDMKNCDNTNKVINEAINKLKPVNNNMKSMSGEDCDTADAIYEKPSSIKKATNVDKAENTQVDDGHSTSEDCDSGITVDKDNVHADDITTDNKRDVHRIGIEDVKVELKNV
ncbi:unnamed protein product [Owenia fusiformis]|uniref:Uncharacterized protein n=1 Tax=Owenia fusiformis TaxID=6347 RepID=A0A8S4N0J3_OWEFU|nr:unnamed protein product [Owenia fusiformis]